MKWGIVYLCDGGVSHVEWCNTPEQAKQYAIREAEITCCAGLSEHIDDESWMEANDMVIYEEDREAGWSLQWMSGGTLEWLLIPGPQDLDEILGEWRELPGEPHV